MKQVEKRGNEGCRSSGIVLIICNLAVFILSAAMFTAHAQPATGFGKAIEKTKNVAAKASDRTDLEAVSGEKQVAQPEKTASVDENIKKKEKETAEEPGKKNMITVKEALDTEKGDELFRQIEEHYRALPPSYDPAGRRDPFRSLIESFDEKETAKIAPRQQVCDPKRKREFLESFDVSSLALVGIINSRNNLALIETPNGKGYILKKGMYIGKNCGKAVNITANRVVLREQMKDLIKGFRVVTTEVKLKKEEE